jgi:hypothetical protein
MSGIKSYTVAIVTAADGSATSYTPMNINGRILKVVFLKGASNCDITIATRASAQAVAETILGVTTVAASTIYYPRAAICTTAGAGGGAGSNLYDYLVVNAPLTITLANGGNAATQTISIFWTSED